MTIRRGSAGSTLLLACGVRAVSRAQYDPIAPNDIAFGRAKNRRSELLIRPKRAR